MELNLTADEAKLLMTTVAKEIKTYESWFSSEHKVRNKEEALQLINAFDTAQSELQVLMKLHEELKKRVWEF